MTVTELRKELEQMETEGRGICPVVVQVATQDGGREYCETSTVRTLAADPMHAPDFDKGSVIVLVE
ncbi:MAG: hypothetical protein ABI789_03630 [Usitatibacter sp.]